MNRMTHPGKGIPGFSLLEVLVAVVILSFGLLSLAALQGSLFKSSAETKAQSVALGLAAEKLEYFRGFKDVATYQALGDGADTAASSTCPGGTLCVGGISYARSWTVDRYAYPKAGGNFALVADTGALSSVTYADSNEFKRVQVDVTWTDSSGTGQRVTLEDAIAGLNPADSRQIGKTTSGSVPRGPEVRIYDPSQQQQGVIPIAIGGDSTCTSGNCAAATNPKPLVNGTNVIETRFDVMTYSGVSGNTAIAQSRVETSLLGCSCDYANAPTSDTAKRPTYWNGYRYTAPEDATYVTPAGILASASNQSALCTVCCRDHHDPVGLASNEPRFDPRHTTTQSGDNSTHSAGHSLMDVTAKTLTAQQLTGAYTESCRVIRVDGLFRVASDTYNDYMNLLATKNDASTTAYLPTSSAIANYQNFVLSYLDARDVSPSTSSVYNNVLPKTAPSTVAGLETANSINTQTPITYNKTDPAKWLHLRGLYVDWLEDPAIQAITDAKTNCKGTSGAAPTSAELRVCVLKVLPFTSINLTELGNWSPLSGTQIVVANNNFIDTLTSVAPVRGKVSLGTSPTANETTNAVATMRRSNSGLTTLPIGIDSEDNSALTPSTWTATQPFTIQGSGGVSGVSFNLYFYAPSFGTNYPFASNTKTPALSNTSGVTCNGTTNAIACSSSVALTAPQTFTVGQYNYGYVGSSSAAISCSNGATTVTYTGPYPTQVCRNYAVSTVSLNGTTNLTGPLSPNGTDGVVGETTTFTMPNSIVTGNNLQITFGTPVDTVQPATCTYSTVCKNKSCTQTTTTYSVVSSPCP